jgi:hypothetical protein
MNDLNTQSVTVSLLDMAYCNNQKAIILTRHTLDDTNYVNSLVFLDVGADTCNMENLVYLPSRPSTTLINPSLLITDNIGFIVFPNSLDMISLTSHKIQTIQMNDINNKIVTLGYLENEENVINCVLLSKQTGVFNLRLNIPGFENEDPSPERTCFVTMEQGVFYGMETRTQNPLLFDVSKFDSTLIDSCATMLSDNILNMRTSFP